MAKTEQADLAEAPEAPATTPAPAPTNGGASPEDKALAPATKPGVMDLASVRMDMQTVAGYEAMQRAAKLFASSALVPEVYRNNLANCFIALNIANRIGADPLMVMQNLYIVHGNPGWSAKFYTATVNACGRFSAIRYEDNGKEGDDYGLRAWAAEKATGERLNGPWVTWSLVKAEGWHAKNGSKWKTMPGLMFMYRAAAWWARAYAPELTMGIHMVEEIEDIGPDAETVSKRRELDLAETLAAAGFRPVPPEE